MDLWVRLKIGIHKLYDAELTPEGNSKLCCHTGNPPLHHDYYIFRGNILDVIQAALNGDRTKVLDLREYDEVVHGTHIP